MRVRMCVRMQTGFCHEILGVILIARSVGCAFKKVELSLIHDSDGTENTSFAMAFQHRCVMIPMYKNRRAVMTLVKFKLISIYLITVTVHEHIR